MCSVTAFCLFLVDWPLAAHTQYYSVAQMWNLLWNEKRITLQLCYFFSRKNLDVSISFSDSRVFPHNKLISYSYESENLTKQSHLLQETYQTHQKCFYWVHQSLWNPLLHSFYIQFHMLIFRLQVMNFPLTLFEGVFCGLKRYFSQCVCDSETFVIFYVY
jgi:hypothetical protein